MQGGIRVYQPVFHPFAPIAGADSHTLILGTMASPKSRENGFYYGHPQNRFWPVLAAVFSREIPKSDDARASLLLDNGLALWDVLCACVRRGSLDSAIREPEGNDFSAFFAACPRVARVLFNGAAARKLFYRFCAASLQGRETALLPSTSPAHTLPYPQKLEIWRKELLR